MNITKASNKAISYACANFHYAKKRPFNNALGYSIFNKQGVWCGVVVFSKGNVAIEKPFGLTKGTVFELIRVALNGKQEQTSKAVAICLMQLKKDCPLVRLVVSYADTNYNHTGVIYQALNFYYTGMVESAPLYKNNVTGEIRHSRYVNNNDIYIYGVLKKPVNKKDCTKVNREPKHKYIYPLDRSLISMCKELSKPYPKTNAAIAHLGERVIFQ